MRFAQLKRRDFFTLLGGAAIAWPLVARAQQPAMPVIGLLNPTSPEATTRELAAFRQGLGEIGFIEGRNVAIEYRWADDHNDRLPGLAADLVNRRVTAIAATGGDSSSLAAKAATTTIPIIFISASDPVEVGLVSSLSRPVGNLTGVSRFGAEIMPKRLELLCEIVPNAPVIDLLVNPTGAIAAAGTKEVEAAARSLGRDVRVTRASDAPGIEAAFVKLLQLGSRALLIMADSYFGTRSEQLGALTARLGIPAAQNRREFVVAGGLLGYDSSYIDPFHQAGLYVGRILKGERPGDLPVQRPTRLELFINLKTAKALGINVPLPLLTRADEVIE
jgi:putative ABC transport system substrate-binding protein